MQKRVLLGIVIAITGLDYYIKQNLTNHQTQLAENDTAKKHKLLQIKPSA